MVRFHLAKKVSFGCQTQHLSAFKPKSENLKFKIVNVTSARQSSVKARPSTGILIRDKT